MVASGLSERIEIRPCDADDFARLMRTTWHRSLREHHRERYAWQEAGAAVYLLAWEGRRLRGRLTLLAESKYDNVRAMLGTLPEVNALTVRPNGRGIGTRLVRAAEALAKERGADRLGIAVSVDNERAARLYRRLGFEDAGIGEVIDTWSEARRFRATLEYCEVGRFLVKGLG